MDLLNPPGFVDDFGLRPEREEALRRGWDAVVTHWLESFAGREGGAFYNFRADRTPGAPAMKRMTWGAFPHPIIKWFKNEHGADRRRWSAAEVLRPLLIGGRRPRRLDGGSLGDPVDLYYRQQDEYCEWFTHRDEAGRADHVTFTSESPEYWRFLAMGTAAFFRREDERSQIVDGDIELVAELYRRHVDPSVTVEDLVWPFDVAAFNVEKNRWDRVVLAGTYNRYNKWTTTHGAMHLTHPANTIVGEFIVASRAAVLRETATGEPIEDPEDVVCCSGFGDPNRFSDPGIGGAIHGLVSDGYMVSLADPVGATVARVNLNAFAGPGGESAEGAWRVDRGDGARGMTVRATFRPPPGASFGLDQMTAGGRSITCGGQIADEVTVGLAGLAKKRDGGRLRPQACEERCCTHPANRDYRAVIGAGDDCAAVDWVELGPVVEPPSLSPPTDGIGPWNVSLGEPDPDAALRASKR